MLVYVRVDAAANPASNNLLHRFYELFDRSHSTEFHNLLYSKKKQIVHPNGLVVSSFVQTVGIQKQRRLVFAFPNAEILPQKGSKKQKSAEAQCCKGGIAP